MAINKLLETNPFYAHFFLSSKIVYDRFNVPTAGAKIGRDGVTLIFSTKYIDTLTLDETIGLIEHEILHVVFDHVSVDCKLYNQKIANLAMDVSINQYIKILPENTLTLAWAEEMCGTKLEKEQTWQYYYSEFMKAVKKVSKGQTLDDHDFSDQEGVGGSGDGGDDRELGRAAVKDMVKESIKNAKGNVPQHIMKEYEHLCSASKVSWKQILANFVARSASSVSKHTRKKTNRRYGLAQPGRNKKRELTLGVCVDSSGSISDESYAQFMSELLRITSHCAKVYFVEADCEVQNVQVITKKKPGKLKRTSNGGTAYQPAITKCLELNCDAIIYFGDFDCADTPDNPHVPFLWVGVGNSPKPGNFGSEIRI